MDDAVQELRPSLLTSTNPTTADLSEVSGSPPASLFTSTNTYALKWILTCFQQRKPKWASLSPVFQAMHYNGLNPYENISLDSTMQMDCSHLTVSEQKLPRCFLAALNRWVSCPSTWNYNEFCSSNSLSKSPLHMPVTVTSNFSIL